MHEFANWFESLPYWAGLTMTFVLLGIPVVIYIAICNVIAAITAKYVWTKPVTISIGPPTKSELAYTFVAISILALFLYAAHDSRNVVSTSSTVKEKSGAAF